MGGGGAKKGGKRQQKMYFLAALAAPSSLFSLAGGRVPLPSPSPINLLKCSWPDILLVPLIDGLPPLPPLSPSLGWLVRWLVGRRRRGRTEQTASSPGCKGGGGLAGCFLAGIPSFLQRQTPPFPSPAWFLRKHREERDSEEEGKDGGGGEGYVGGEKERKERFQGCATQPRRLKMFVASFRKL